MEKKTDFKALSKKAKVQYIWDYYKFHILVAICAVAFVVSLIYHYATYKESVLNIIMVNVCDPYRAEMPGLDDFFEEAGLDTSTEEINVDTSNTYNLEDDAFSTNYYSDQTLTLKLSVGGTDIFFAPEQVFSTYGSAGCLMDLSTVLTEEEMEQYADLFLYASDEENTITIPCGVLLENNSWLMDNGYYDGPCYFGIANNTDNVDLALSFFRYVMSHETIN